MPPQTLKRQAEDVSLNNDDIDDNKLDVTWGGTKKSRYLYSYTLQSPDLFPNINDPNQTEIEVSVEPEFSSESNCDSDCSCYVCQSCSSQSDHTEIVVKNNDSFLHKPGYFTFLHCLQCKKKNTNPNFQFCDQCFRYRLKCFDSKPNHLPKSIKRLYKMAYDLEESRFRKDFEESSQESISSSFGSSNLYFSQESFTDNPKNICNICLLKPKNGIFNHKSTGHVYCCYSCSKIIWAKSGKCPICNLKVRNVTKAICV